MNLTGNPRVPAGLRQSLEQTWRDIKNYDNAIEALKAIVSTQ